MAYYDSYIKYKFKYINLKYSKQIGGMIDLKQKLMKSGNALPKILTTFYSFLQFFTDLIKIKI